MNSQLIIMYVLKTILVAGIFLGYYYFALRNKKFHHYNRFYLLFSLVLSITIPLLNFAWFTVDTPVIYGTGETLNYIINAGGVSSTPAWNRMDWVLASGSFIAFGFLLVLLININKIYRLKRKSVVTRMGEIDFIDTEEDNAPFSYLKNLFWKQSISLDQEEGKKILKHELTHIQQKHTLDRLFCQILCSVIWVNPFYWIIQKELIAIHEFIADEEAIGHSDTESFAKMLLQAHYGNHFLQQTQSFFYSSIKRRLLMLTTSKNTRYSYARRLIALPLLVATIAVFSFQVNAREENTNTNNTQSTISQGKTTKAQKDSTVKKAPATAVQKSKQPLYSVKEDKPSYTVRDNKPLYSVKEDKPLYTVSDNKKEPTFTVVQEKPKFPGGSEGWKKFLNSTINNNKITEKGGPPGKYKVDLSFLIDKDGDVRDVIALNDPGFGSKEEAMRVLLSSPKWTPAMQNGKKVIYRDKISMTYVVSEE